MRGPLFCALSLVLCLAPHSAQAQSNKIETPAPLAAGVNRGTLDSFVGDHYWQVWLNPGHFDVVFSRGNSHDFADMNMPVDIAVAFKPPVPGATFTRKNAGGTVTFSGSTPKRVLLLIGMSPPKSSLVRQTVPYTLAATGSADFTGAPAPDAAPNVVGVYALTIQGHGSAKLTADGNILTTTGEHGHWELFDAASRTYVVSIGRDHWELIFQPGRGFVEVHSGNLILVLPQQ